MEQNHIKIEYEGNGYVFLTPEENFMLLNTLTNTTNSDAEVLAKDVVNFRAVPIEQEE